MSIGIPFAPSTITDYGVLQVCPVCDEMIRTPFAEFDADGEQVGKDDAEPTPTPYQLHFMVYHPDA